MKRLALIFAATALTAISAPTAARAQTGCSWWDLTCNGLANRITDYGWHMTGRDAAGNVVYVRRLVDSNGNVVYERARRNDFGRYVVVNNHVIRKGTVYGPNGEICKYNQNAKGYKEDCKYAKANVLKPSNGYNTRYEAPKPKPVKYEPAKVHTVQYHPAKVHTVKYDAPKVHDVKIEQAKGVKYDAPKGKEEKGKGPKH